MGIFDRLEGKISSAYLGAFARTMRSGVQPVEIASSIRRAMDDRAAGAGRGRAVVPNVFTIELSETDYEILLDEGDDLNEELVAAAEEHADSQHYTLGGPLTIHLVEAVDLETGVFQLRPAIAKRPDASGFTGQQRVVRPPSSPYDDAPQRPEPQRPEPPHRQPHHPEPRRPEPQRDHYDNNAYDDADYDEDVEEEVWDDEGGATPDGPQEEHAAYPVAPPAPPKPKKVKPADRPWFDIDGDRYILMGARSVIGRDESADVGLDDPGISRRHAEVRVTIDGPHFVAALRDLGSTNGTFVNGDRINSTRLQDGDRVTVGRTTMTYRVRR